MREIIVPYAALLEIIDSYKGKRPCTDMVHIRVSDAKTHWYFLAPSKDGDVR